MSDEDRNVLRLLSSTALLSAGSLEKQVSKLLSNLLLVVVSAYNDSARMQVVVESLGLAQELRAEDDNEVCVAVSRGLVCCCVEAQLALASD